MKNFITFLLSTFVSADLMLILATASEAATLYETGKKKELKRKLNTPMYIRN